VYLLVFVDVGTRVFMLKALPTRGAAEIACTISNEVYLRGMAPKVCKYHEGAILNAGGHSCVTAVHIICKENARGALQQPDKWIPVALILALYSSDRFVTMVWWSTHSCWERRRY
jgi:hypothetical protein